MPDTDSLSPAAAEVLRLDAASAYTKLVVRGGGNPSAQGLLSGLAPADLFVATSGVSESNQKAALAGLWLWHDWLDESHTLSQSIHDSTGSFWHAVMHRREGDFSNSKYWYAKAAGHPALAVLAAQAGSIVSSMPADGLLLRIVMRGFDPNALVDLVEAVHDKPKDSRHRAAVALQQLEWRVLFDHGRR
jgi:hypothetical protein